jgi:hypothetical protein
MSIQGSTYLGGYNKILPFNMGVGSRVYAVHHRMGEGAFPAVLLLMGWRLNFEPKAGAKAKMSLL